GNSGLAFKLYNEAIELANDRGFVQLVALANERAAISCVANKQRRLAAWYLECATKAYHQWGAATKVAMLHRDFSALFSGSTTERIEITSGNPTSAYAGENFDIAAAAAASQIVALEYQKERVIVNLLQVIRAQAGAEAAHLIVPAGGGYRLEASAVANPDDSRSENG